MSINRYECHNMLLICVAVDSGVFIVTQPLVPKDESVCLRSALRSSDILRDTVPGKTGNFYFILFQLVIRTENHVFLILLYDFRLPISKETSKERQMKKLFSPKNGIF